MPFQNAFGTAVGAGGGAGNTQNPFFGAFPGIFGGGQAGPTPGAPPQALGGGQAPGSGLGGSRINQPGQFGSTTSPFNNPNDFMRRLEAQAGRFETQQAGGTPLNLVNQLGGQLFGGLETLFPKGLAGVLDILKNEGRTNPATLQRGIRDIDRQRQQAQLETTQRAAASGLGGTSGLLATQAAIDRGAGAQRSDLFAQEAAQTEDRRRSDLTNLLGNLLLGPATSVASGTPFQPGQNDRGGGFGSALGAGLGGAASGLADRSPGGALLGGLGGLLGGLF